MISRTLLESAVQDSNRRNSESAIRIPKDKQIFVEGWFDYFFFRDFSRDFITISLQKLEGKNGGKAAVIAKVEESEDYFGIVDMDHDFYSDDFKSYDKEKKKYVKHNRITDTKSNSCLYSFITSDLSEDELMQLYQNMVIDCCIDLQHKGTLLPCGRNNLLSEIKQNFTQFNQYLKERTIAYLWRGYEGEKRSVPPALNNQNWENIHRDDLTTQVGDLIDGSIDVYKRWKLTYEDELNLVGINDHRLIDGLMLLFKEYLPTFEENSYTISRILERSLSSNLKKYGKKQHFEHFLDILQLS